MEYGKSVAYIIRNNSRMDSLSKKKLSPGRRTTNLQSLLKQRSSNV